ncbi:MAG: molybdopterin-dependent oxidoreductase, partial [Dehalococcoidaceae bacterium]|nr:molybdopterin-dependent oxidoreductase [Dehalococcoidaceae bacterium]
TQHTTGTDNVMALANLAMATGHVGREGSGVCPLRGQNNVQGACDMGALPNVYTGYQPVTDAAVKEKFENAWGTKLDGKAGLTLVEMMHAVQAGKIRAMYVMGEEPALTDPDSCHVEAALKNLDFLVVQNIFMGETGKYADVILPGASFAEKDGTFTNTERRVQRVRRAIKPVGDSRPDWVIISQVSARMGYEMKYHHPSEIMAEIASLTPTYAGINYDRLEQGGLQWPCRSAGDPGTKFLHENTFTRGPGKFAVTQHRDAIELPDDKYPLIFTTGRNLYHWHGGTMSRQSPGLEEICPEGLAEINPDDAVKMGLDDGDIVEMASRRGKIKARISVTEKSPPGVVFMPFHFKESPANRLTLDALDPVARIPELKVCAVRISKAENLDSGTCSA